MDTPDGLDVRGMAVGELRERAAHGRTLQVLRLTGRTWVVRFKEDRTRARFADTLAETAADVAHALAHGVLPRERGASWS
jgi:hypothetical protein